jgi:1-deoxy-D-xylulose-5-phosphate reductoisomerase
MKKLIILGSTGSIGTQAVEIIEKYPERFEVVGLAAFGNVTLLQKQINKVNPKAVAIVDPKKAQQIKKDNPQLIVFSGDEANIKLIQEYDADMVLVSIVGVAALKPTLEALKSGKAIALASKEIMVAAGHIVTDLARKKKLDILPVDSEHAAIHMCLEGRKHDAVEALILTASGGPFFNKDINLAEVTLAQALKHPKWTMGQKITIDSSTLMNKGLEVIEAHWLFDIPYSKIDVVIHPQSIVHSMVEYVDGSVISQMSLPDMRLPILYAFSYPETLKASWPKLDLTKIHHLDFHQPDLGRFRALDLAIQAGKSGGSSTTVLNAANEQAVELFLKEQIGYLDITNLVEDALNECNTIKNPDLDEIIESDLWAREFVRNKAQS